MSLISESAKASGKVAGDKRFYSYLKKFAFVVLVNALPLNLTFAVFDGGTGLGTDHVLS